MNSWSNFGSSSSSYTLTVSTQSASSDYRCVITLPGPPVMIFTSTLVSVVNAYCAPFLLIYGCIYADTINNFVLVGESNTRIYDLNTGCAANNYDNRTSQSVNLFAGMTYTSFISSQYSSSEYSGIWIDFNNDCVFSSTEMVGSGLLSGTADTPISMVIPTVAAGGTLGVHRMRVAVLYYTTANPCGTSASYGEIHDYSVNIISYACKCCRF